MRDKIWIKNSNTGEVRSAGSEKEANGYLVLGGSNNSDWKRVAGRKDHSLYVAPKPLKKLSKKEEK